MLGEKNDENLLKSMTCKEKGTVYSNTCKISRLEQTWLQVRCRVFLFD